MSDPVHDSQRSVLEEQIEAFLSRGGEITEVPTGKSAVGAHKPSHWKRLPAKQTGPKE